MKQCRVSEGENTDTCCESYIVVLIAWSIEDTSLELMSGVHFRIESCRQIKRYLGKAGLKIGY